MSKNPTKAGATTVQGAVQPVPKYPPVLVTNSVCTSSEPLVRQAVTIKLANQSK